MNCLVFPAVNSCPKKKIQGRTGFELLESWLQGLGFEKMRSEHQEKLWSSAGVNPKAEVSLITEVTPTLLNISNQCCTTCISSLTFQEVHNKFSSTVSILWGEVGNSTQFLLPHQARSCWCSWRFCDVTDVQRCKGKNPDSSIAIVVIIIIIIVV